MEGKNLSQPESLGQYEQQKKISSLLLSLKNKVSESLTDINLLKLCDDHLLQLEEVALYSEPLKIKQLVNKFSEFLLTIQSLQNFE